MNFYNVAAIIMISISSIGCGSGRTIVTEESQGRYRVETAKIEEALSQGGVDIGLNQKLLFEKHLQEQLYRRGRFTKGDDLVIRYHFADADEGSRAGRYFIGHGVGEGSVSIVVAYFDRRGKELSSTETIGTVTGGGTGGSMSEAIEHAAEEIAKFTVRKFLSSYR